MSNNKETVTAVIIGGGIGGLATATILAKAGVEVSLYEKNDRVGGRAGILEVDGFTFDTGPSWFLMPEVFEHFFSLIGEDMHSVLDLKKLEPAYKVIFEEDIHSPLIITGDEAKDTQTFDAIEPGSGSALTTYIDRSEETYKLATETFLYTNFRGYVPFMKPNIIKRLPRMAAMGLRTINSYVSSYVQDEKLKKILQYPMVFLGTSPYSAPALYQLMSYLDFRQGVFYPQGGMYTIIDAIAKKASKLGVEIHSSSPVKQILTSNSKATGIQLEDGTTVQADIIISNADLHFTETKLLPKEVQTYPEKYWGKKTASPGAILFYLGVKGAVPELKHHTLLFTKDWKHNFDSIFKTKQYPHPASIYICRASATDKTVAPKGHENIFILVPVPADETISKEDTAEHAERYLDQIIDMTGIKNLRERIVYKKVVGPADFADDLNAWHGSALGLAHPLLQSALWRPQNKSKKLRNLYYVGGNTIPGIGLPMCLISSELIYKHLTNDNSAGPIESIEQIRNGDQNVAI
ncbi:phytoene desaturase [Candidatus Saccharibacteria bacterium]|nr:phytoene desaturase [Candidatus Saccharibacteria bacterium]